MGLRGRAEHGVREDVGAQVDLARELLGDVEVVAGDHLDVDVRVLDLLDLLRRKARVSVRVRLRARLRRRLRRRLRLRLRLRVRLRVRVGVGVRATVSAVSARGGSMMGRVPAYFIGPPSTEHATAIVLKPDLPG